jgi:hypothetical protein
MVTDEANRIWSAFARYAEQRDESLVVEIPREQIESTIAQFTNRVDRDAPAYRSMELRIEKLKELDAEAKDKKKLLQGIGIGFLIGIAVKIIGDYLWRWLTN